VAKVEFFFDCSSPWTYLAFSRIEGVCQKTAAELIWRPILVGGVFNAVNQDIYQTRANPHPIKARYADKDLQDWARYCDVTINWPEVFPVRAVDCMRGAFVALDAGVLPAYARALFEAYWGAGRDISQVEELALICQQVGLDKDTFFQKVATADVKYRLRENTEELVRRGGFGSPTMFVNSDDMYFGNDRLALVEVALRSGGDAE
tara:strand:+ start:1160 stop:1774 length:615 start_codon:yes stop_codon:yes gene_type:complete